MRRSRYLASVCMKCGSSRCRLERDAGVPNCPRKEKGRARLRRDAAQWHKTECAMIETSLPTMTRGHCVTVVTATVQQLNAAAQVRIDRPMRKLHAESNLRDEAFDRAPADDGYAKA